MKILLFVLALAGIGLLVYMNVVDRTQVRHPAAPTTVPADESADAAPTAEAAPADSSAEAASRIRPWRIDRSQVVAVHGAEVAFEADDVIRLRMPSAEWDCGLRIVPPSGASAMDLSGAFSLAMDVENCSTDRQMRLTLHLSSGGRNSDSDDHATAILAKNRSANIGIGLNPGERATMRIPLMHPEIYLAPEGALGPHVLDTARINTIEIKAQWPFEDEFRWVADCRIANIRLEGVPDVARKVPAERYRPFIDPYGQFVHDDWPEKVKDDAALQADLAEERAALLPPPKTWDEYGGCKDGPQLAPTGHFRTEKVDGKWYLVTPSGHLFFSTGIDVIRNVTDASDGGKNPDWYVQDVQPGMRMAFSDWNIAKKFGKQDYLSEYYAFVQDRLASWGMNTIGNWSARELLLESRTPYVATVFERDPSIPSIPGLKHYDCFDETFASALQAAVRRRFADDPALAKARTDPRCIGFFIDNELNFNGVVNGALAADFDTCAAKRALLAYAWKQYGAIEKLNAAWETAFTTFAELKTLQKPPSGPGFRNDATAFATAWYERYFRACRDALAEAAPGKLYLGARFVGFRQSPHLWNTAAKYCDVVTVNTYANSIFNISQNIYRDSPVEKPILVGEFHFGTFDRGMFKAGLCPVADQAERARSYTRFVQGALCHPLIVGCHWFQYRDQPLIGRGDGEAYQIGFVDTCDRVYPELAQAAREVGEHLYAYRMRGKLQDAMDQGRLIPRVHATTPTITEKGYAMKGWLHGFLCGALSAISASASTEGRGVAFAANKSQDPTVSAARAFAADTVDGKLAVAITSPGQDIGNASDSGSFYFFPEIGDCEVVATIPPLMQTGENAAIGNFAKAGIMFRLSTHANAPMVMFLRETSRASGSALACRSRMIYRAADGADAVDLKTTTGDFPADASVRCRLVRQGHVFSAWHSTNALAAWTPFAQWTAPTNAFADGILGGVALTPQNAATPISTTFDDVAVRGLVQATVQDAAVHVAWNAEGVCPPGHFLRGFTVSRSEAGATAQTVLNPDGPVFGHSLVDTQAVGGVSYRYRVDAEVVPSSEGPLVLEAAQVVPVYGAQATLEAGGSIRLRTRSAEWSSGVRLVPPDGEEGFDFSKAHSLAVDVENLSTIKQMRLTMHLSSEGDDDEPQDHASAVLSGTRTINTGIGLNPGEKGTMRIRLPHPDIYLAPENAKGPYVIDTSNIVDIAFKSLWPFEEEFEWLVDCRLHNLRLEGVPDYSRKIPDAAYCPFVDAYGQFIHEAWPEKVKDDNAFANDLATETAALRSAPASWDEYGGWKDGPQLTATGSFRAEKVDGKWYLVTPSGHLFFSLGIDVIRNAVDSPDGSLHPDWYATPVPGSRSMAFPHWNLQLKFGKSDYLADYDAFVLRRLDDWGVNTLGNWSGIPLMRSGGKPYVLSLFELHAALPRLGAAKFYDCFDPAFIPGMTNAVHASFSANAAAQQSVTDPMCIGYFIDNELDFSDPVGKALKLDYDVCAAKRTFLERAEAKYGTIQSLNAAWATSFASWADVKAMTSAPVGAGFSTDRAAFEAEWYARYFQACHDAIQATSPAKLYLGSRFVGFRQSERLWSAAAQHCDVVSVNAYANSVFNVSKNLFRNSAAEKPILVGEFHFGTFGRGMFAAGLCPVGDETERARSFTRYVQGALCHPLIVGCHWFQYRDQPLVGRGDGEAYQVGFVDVCDRVYPKLVQAARDIGENLYTYRQRGVLSIPMDPEVPTP